MRYRFRARVKRLECSQHDAPIYSACFDCLDTILEQDGDWKIAHLIKDPPATQNTGSIPIDAIKLSENQLFSVQNEIMFRFLSEHSTEQFWVEFEYASDSPISDGMKNFDITRVALAHG